jgi:DNA gyrase/topoisomerase IV subunit B
LDPIIGKNLKLHCNFIQQEIEIPINVSNFLPEDTLRISNKEWGTIILWPSYENSCSVSFINGSQCTGIHQRIINDWINEYFEYNLAHHFYETLVSLNVPSTLMRFADQNKTKYAVSRFEIEDILKNIFHNKIINSLKGSRITQEIEKRIEDRLYSENIKVIKKAQRTSRRKISDKYSAASKYKESIFVTEGISASGSLRQARDPETEAVYSLKGKIKNTRRLSDLTSNAEILEIMSILNMTPNEKKKPAYDNIIIATDSDEDGNHITSLIINLFYKWFPYIIEDGRLFKLTTPLVVCDYKNERKYFLTSEEFHKFSEGKSVSNVNYLKGLGSLSIEDWKYVMNNKILLKIIDDRSAKRFLNIAFGDSTALRKEWLAKK